MGLYHSGFVFAIVIQHLSDYYRFCIFRPLECSKGYFGKNCLRECSPYCKPDTCQHTDGWCTCSSGWMGDNCAKCNYQWSLRKECSLFIAKCKIWKISKENKLDVYFFLKKNMEVSKKLAVSQMKNHYLIEKVIPYESQNCICRRGLGIV